MNHRADSWKKNLAINVAKPLIAEHWRLLSYTIVESVRGKCGDEDLTADETRKIPDARASCTNKCAMILHKRMQR
jgi:hypothetical protein